MNIKKHLRRFFSPYGYWCCESCGRRVYPDQKFCGFCGEEQGWDRCPNCDEILYMVDEQYCTHCGDKLNSKTKVS